MTIEEIKEMDLEALETRSDEIAVETAEADAETLENLNAELDAIEERRNAIAIEIEERKKAITEVIESRDSEVIEKMEGVKEMTNKKSEKKDFIEWYICEQTVKFVLTDANISRIAERVVALSEEELGSGELARLEERLAEIEREIDAAADSLIKTNSPALIKRINEKVAVLEAQQQATETEISRLRVRQELRVTVREVEAFLRGFCSGDLFDEDFRRRLIKTLVNCIYLFDDKVVIYYNVRGIKEISYIDMLSDVEELSENGALGGSDSSRVSPPTKNALLSTDKGAFFE